MAEREVWKIGKFNGGINNNTDVYFGKFIDVYYDISTNLGILIITLLCIKKACTIWNSHLPNDAVCRSPGYFGSLGGHEGF